MFSLDYLSLMEFAGPDAGTFLHAQLSADILALDTGQSGYACLCNPAGRVLGLMLVQRCAENYRAVVAASLADALTDWLAKYILRSKVAIARRRDLAVVGLGSGDTIDEASGVIAGIGQARYALVDPPAEAADAALRADRWKAQELEAGVAWLDEASSAQFLPQMLGFDRIGAVSFRKGCYPGQEIIARTRYLGQLKRHPFHLRLETTIRPASMAPVQLLADGEQAAGVVVDHAVADGAETVMLVVARAAQDFRPTTLVWEDGSLPVSAARLPGLNPQEQATT